MKPIHALAILGALAAGPALAQEYPSGPLGQPQSPAASRPEAVIMGVEIPEQAVQPQFMAQVQQQLQQAGFYEGPIDGLYGDRTQAALAAWQRQQGLQPTGQLNAQTLAAMDVDSMATQQAELPQQQQQTGQQQSTGEQQARQPGAEEDAVEIEQLRQEHMSAPNVQGESVPERPGTGVPAPGRSAEELTVPPRD
jgi:hypothetical protein